MAKIPRRRDAGFGVTDYVRYKPSAPPMAPLGLADYSSVTDALDKGARFAADRHNEEQDLEARAYTDNFINSADLLLTSNLDEFGRYDYQSLDEAVEKSNQEWKRSFSELYDDGVIANMPARRAQEFMEKVHLFETKHTAGVRKHKTEAIVANTKAVQIRHNEGFLANVRDFNFPLDPTLTKFEDHWAARLAAARDGGKLENTAQVQQAYVKALKEMGGAIFERYNTLAVEKVTKGLIKSKDDLQFSMVREELGSDVSIGKYASYLDLIRGIEGGDFARYFSNPSPHEMIRKLNKSVETALKSATSLRGDQLKKNAYGHLHRLMEKSAREPITHDEVVALADDYAKAGMPLPPGTWATLENMHTKPTPRDDAVHNGFMKLYYEELRKSEDGVIPRLGWLRDQLEIWQTDKNPEGRALHGKHVSKILELLRKEQSGQNKEVNKSAQDVLKRINDEFGFGKFEAGITLGSGEYVAWKTLNDSLGFDISQYVNEFVRSRYNEAKAAGQHFNQAKVTQEVMDLITQGVNKRGLSAAHLRIPEDQLRGAYTRKTADILNKTKTATAYDDLLIELAKVRLNRITRMLNNDTLSITKNPNMDPERYGNWVRWLRELTPARREKAFKEGKAHWWRQLEFAPLGANIKDLQIETGFDAAVRGEPAEGSAGAEKSGATTQETTTDDGVGSPPALPEKEMPPEVKKETKINQDKIASGQGEEVGAEDQITEEPTTTEFPPPDLSTEVESGKFPALTNKVLGQTADGRNIYANERDTEGYDSESSERAFHFQHTDGKWYSYPTIFNGKEISPADAYKLFVENGGVDPESGVVSPAFDDEQGVLDYMTERSEGLSDHLHRANQVQKLRDEGSPYEAVVSAISALYEGSDAQKFRSKTILSMEVIKDVLSDIVLGDPSEKLSTAWSTIKGLYNKYDGSIDRMVDGLAGYLQKKLEHRERGEGEYEPEGPEDKAFEDVITQLEAGAGGGEEKEPVQAVEPPQIEEPTLGGEEEPAVFDPEGAEYDYEGAKAAGLTPNEAGKWSSRDPKTGLLFKGHGHISWHKTVAAEEELGNTIIKGEDGRYYSINPMEALVKDFTELTGIKDAWDGVPDEFRSEVSKAVTQYVEEHGVVGDGQDIIDIINKVTAEGTTLQNKGVLKKKPSDKKGMYPPPKDQGGENVFGIRNTPDEIAAFAEKFIRANPNNPAAEFEKVIKEVGESDLADSILDYIRGK